MSKELQDAFKRLGGQGSKHFIAKVVDVDKNNGICTVSADELEYTEVRLSAVVKERSDVFYLFPVPGSYVIVSPIYGDLHNLLVIAYSEVEELKMTTGDSELKVTSAGFKMQRRDESLKKLMDDMHSDLKDICDYIKQTATVAGAAAVVPLAIVLKEKFDLEYPVRVNQLLNDD